MDDPTFRRAHNALHVLWTKAGGDDYNKQEWRELDAAITALGVKAMTDEERDALHVPSRGPGLAL
jgi:hypothetical protein